MEDTIFSTLVKLMNGIDTDINLTGREKRLFVITEITKILTGDLYERYELFISIIINGLADISTKKIILNINKRKKCLLKCIKK